MARDINLNSQDWTSLVFERKNKEYGAYEMRESSSDRHALSLIIVTGVALFMIYLPSLIKNAIPEKQVIVDNSVLVDLKNIDIETQMPEENLIRKIENIPPPPLLMKTIIFTPPSIVQDDQVREDDLMATQQDLTDTDAAISIATIEGVEGGTVNIADLDGHKVVVQAVEEPIEIHSYVEVPPQFPGGDAELMKWLQANLNYPTRAQEQGIQGRVVLRFVVGPDGSVGQIEIQKTLDPTCDQEAVRVVKKMPNWLPGKQNGRPVYVYFTLPIQFKLQ